MRSATVQYLTAFLPETFTEKKTAACLLSSLDRESLEAVIRSAVSGYVRFVARKFRNRAVIDRKNPDINEVLSLFCDRNSKRTGYASKQLQSRFDAQDDEMKTEIACAMLRCGNVNDRRWISDKLSDRWDERCLSVLLEVWEASGYYGPLTALAYRRAPLGFLRERRDVIVCSECQGNEMDYRLKARFCEDESETLVPEEWGLRDYLYICLSSGRKADIPAAQRMLRGTLTGTIDGMADSPSGHFIARMRDVPFCIADLPGVREMIWYLSQLGLTEMLDEIISWDKEAAAEASGNKCYASAYCNALKRIIDCNENKKQEVML